MGRKSRAFKHAGLDLSTPCAAPRDATLTAAQPGTDAKAIVSPGPRRRRSNVPSEDLLRRLRVALIRKATLSVEGRPEEVLLIDVALTGAFVERAQPLPVGTSVELSFRLPDNEIPVQARGRVAWCHRPPQRLVSKRLPPGIGVDLTEMESDDHLRLRAFLLERYQRGPRGRQFMRPWPVAAGLDDAEGGSGPALPGREFAPDLLPEGENSQAVAEPAPDDSAPRTRV